MRITKARVLKDIAEGHSFVGANLPRTIIPLYDNSEESILDEEIVTNNLQEYLNMLTSEEQSFTEFFTKVTGGLEPWGAQKTWLRRLIRGENTVLVAPTGLGKTTLLLVYVLYGVKKGKKVLYITPTKVLQKQVYEKISIYAKNAEMESIRLVTYDGSSSKKLRDGVLEKIHCCDFDVLIVTNAFTLKNHKVISKCDLDIVIADDVDSLLKSEKSTRVLLKLLGYDDAVIELAKKRSEILWKILLGRTVGKDVYRLVEEYLEVDRELELKLKTLKTRQLVVASATAKTRSGTGRLLRDLLKVDITGITVYGRDVTDCYVLAPTLEEFVSIVASTVTKLGRGCILYTPPFHPYREHLNSVLAKVKLELANRGFRVEDASPKTIARLISGEVDVLVGSASCYSMSVRGLDAPKNVRYAIFIGTPVYSIPLETFLASLNNITRTLDWLYEKTGNQEYKITATRIRKRSLALTPSEKRLIKLVLLGKIPEEAVLQFRRLHDFVKDVRIIYEKTLDSVREVLRNEEVAKVGTITLVKRLDGRIVAVIPDVVTYIQASGRTSRLVGNAMTHGFSLVVECSNLSNLILSLDERLKKLSREKFFVRLDEVNLDYELQRIDETRNEKVNEKLDYRSVLLVVESPTKAKTISRFFGRPSSRKIGDVKVYTIPAKVGDEVVELNVVATRGHIYDLTTKNVGMYGVVFGDGVVNPVYTSIKKCKACNTQFVSLDKCPKCGCTAFIDSKSVVAALQKLALEVDEIYLATDPDIEGEKIAYDVYISLLNYNSNIKRVELHEITVNELLKAMKNPRSIDFSMVEAEVYRRVLDRLVGFALSDKLKRVFNGFNYGAGRVQTPVLGLVVNRYEEYVTTRCKRVVLELGEPVYIKISTCIDKQREDLLNSIKNSREVLIVKQSEALEEVFPKPPYTTDELLADASRRGFTVYDAMRLAQELFESGLITYHRTDCTYVSSQGISVAREYIASKNMLEMFRPNHWGSKGSHEAIRPVYPLDIEGLVKSIEEGVVNTPIPLTNRHLRLYDMIFRRFIASQMKPFKAIRAEYSVVASDLEVARITLYVDIVEPGFNKVVNIKLHAGLRGIDVANVPVISVKIYNSSKVPLYTEGDVVSLMKKLGIGRPSTYSKIVENLKRHGYVVTSKKANKIVPTKRGIQVYKYLINQYPELTSIELTRKMEETIDRIAKDQVPGYIAVVELVQALLSMGLVEYRLLPSYLNNYVGSYTSIGLATSN